jgi:hypothetical protein
MLSELKELNGHVKDFDKARCSYWRLAAPMAATLALGIYSNQCEASDIWLVITWKTKR